MFLVVAAIAAKASRINLPKRFSLRSLFIATTLVAIVLGLVAVLAR